MKANRKGGQDRKQSVREDQNQQSGNQGSSSRADRGIQGGTHEQHVEAGRQSHKNDARDGSRQSGSGSRSGRAR
ncbi:MAG: hypothetical protein V4484_16895 [Pseudomonadota bacterium]